MLEAIQDMEVGPIGEPNQHQSKHTTNPKFSFSETKLSASWTQTPLFVRNNLGHIWKTKGRLFTNKSGSVSEKFTTKANIKFPPWFINIEPTQITKGSFEIGNLWKEHQRKKIALMQLILYAVRAS